MIENASNKPSFRCKAYAAMARAWTIVRDVSKGTLNLRDKGKVYLPQFPAEHDNDYKVRTGAATLFNAYARTVQGLVGMVFKKNPVLSTDVPQQIKDHAENIDLAGSHLDVFAKEAFTDLFDGHVFFLVDMQKALGPGATLADELRAGIRPYWVKYSAAQAINFRTANINGQKVVGQITFEEETSVEDGNYGEKCVMRYRTFRLVPYSDAASRETSYAVAWELLEKQKDASTGQETFATIDFGVVPNFTRIPVAVAYGKRTGFLESQPPLLDLALLNISYFQKRSDYDGTLHKCGFPIPIFKGIEEDIKKIEVGSGLGVRIPADGDAKYLEPAGTSLDAARLDLQDLRGEMATLGLSVLAGQPNVEKTATASVIDFSQESSELETMVRSMSDALELCCDFHAQYLGLGEDKGGSISLGSHLKNMRLSQAQIQTYSNMAKESQLSHLTLWEILQNSDALPDTFEAKNEEQRLKNQQATFGVQPPNPSDNGGVPGGAGAGQ
ncbi:MAG: hypothetical protein QOD00_1709 [Blastocatellia bacterium]|nr:hypothetical protein [Blastocatellia bacterium]